MDLIFLNVKSHLGNKFNAFYLQVTCAVFPTGLTGYSHGRNLIVTFHSPSGPNHPK